MRQHALVPSAALALLLSAAGCPTDPYGPPAADDDTGDDDATGDDDTTGDDDSTGDDDTTVAPYTCADFCAMEQEICVDWTGSGYTCEDFCLTCMNAADLACLEACPQDPLLDGCACVWSCLSIYIPPPTP